MIYNIAHYALLCPKVICIQTNKDTNILPVIQIFTSPALFWSGHLKDYKSRASQDKFVIVIIRTSPIISHVISRHRWSLNKVIDMTTSQQNDFHGMQEKIFYY